METAFIAGMRRANLCSLNIFSEIVTVNGVEIKAAVDDLSKNIYARSGGRTVDTESALFVSKEDWATIGGRQGTIITFSDGQTSKVQKVTTVEGAFYLALAPFKP